MASEPKKSFNTRESVRIPEPVPVGRGMGKRKARRNEVGWTGREITVGRVIPRGAIVEDGVYRVRGGIYNVADVRGNVKGWDREVPITIVVPKIFHIKVHVIHVEGPLDEITDFAMARPIVKPKPESFSNTDELAGAFLTNIMDFLQVCPDRRFSFCGFRRGDISF